MSAPHPPSGDDVRMGHQKLASKLRRGFVVFGVLVAIEILEYSLGVSVKRGVWPYLALLAVIGAWPIVRYFMHIQQLWRLEE